MRRTLKDRFIGIAWQGRGIWTVTFENNRHLQIIATRNEAAIERIKERGEVPDNYRDQKLGGYTLGTALKAIYDAR